MKHLATHLVIVVTLILSGCSGESAITGHQVSLAPLFNSDLSAVRCQMVDGHIELEAAEISPEGIFFHLTLPSRTHIADELWIRNSSVLHLSVPEGDGLDVGVVPLRAYSGGSISAVLVLGDGVRAVSAPPVGAQNLIDDLSIQPSPEPEQTELAWTEFNRGDFDFNGEVNLADLVPLAEYFGSTYNRLAFDARLQTPYWLDGNGDGKIEITDLTPIGRNYGSEVFGFVVERDGNPAELSDGQSFLSRADAEIRLDPPLPPRYQAIAVGMIDAVWEVTPVDFALSPGTGSETVVFDKLDLVVTVSTGGLELFEINTMVPDLDEFSQHIMRVIDPLDDPASAPVAHPDTINANAATFNNLPREELLLLEIIHVPQIDPVTGSPHGGTPQDFDPETLIADYGVTSRIPFVMPRGNNQLHIDAQFLYVPNPAGGLYLDRQTRSGLADSFTDTTVRTDFLTATVATDTNQNDTYADEAWLQDPERDGLSLARIRQLQDFVSVRSWDKRIVEYTGTIVDIDVQLGLLNLEDVVMTDDQLQTTELETLFLQFSEFTEFSQEFTTLPNDLAGLVDPGQLNAEDYLRISAEVYWPASETDPSTAWAKLITRVVDL